MQHKRKPMLKSLFGSTLCLAFLVVSNTALAQHVSNGGNYVSTEFLTKARLIHSYLVDHPEHPISQNIDTQAYQKAINSTIIEVSDEETLLDSLDRPSHAVVLPNPCPPTGGCRIVLKKDFWDEALRTNLDVYRLVFHEFLRVMGLEDENNQISSQLDIDLNDFGRGGILEIDDLKNLSFENDDFGFNLPLYWFISTVNWGYRVSTSSSTARTGDNSLHLAADMSQAAAYYLAGVSPFAAVGQCFDAKPYWGKSVHLSGYIKTQNLYQGAASLWLRVDGPNGVMRILDNMSNRGITGTTNWRRADLIVYLEENIATHVCFGPLLMNGGQAWYDDLRVRIIDEN